MPERSEMNWGWKWLAILDLAFLESERVGLQPGRRKACLSPPTFFCRPTVPDLISAV